MSEIDDAKKRLAKAVQTLDKVLTSRGDEAGAAAARQIAELTAQAQAQSSEIEALQRENGQLKAAATKAQTDYSALEEVADTVGTRLDTAITGIRQVLEH